MLNKLMITTALSGLMIGGALAQNPTTQPMTPTQPQANQPQTTQPQANQPAMPGVKAAERAAHSSPSAGAGDAKFINAQATDQWLSSNFIGVDVIGPDNEKIGDVTDILFEKNGNVVGYVVGVGGFLGIGAKNVALAPTSFEVVADTDRATTGSAATSARADDVKLKLNMTKDQLQQAASFETKREQESKARSASQPAPGGMNNRPAPLR